MRLGANTWIWTSPFRTEDVGLIHKIAEIGFDIAEVAIEDPSLVDTVVLKQAVREAGVSCIVCGAFGPDRDLGSDNATLRQNSLDYIRRLLAVCEEVGSPVLPGPAYASVGDTRLRTPEESARRWNHVVENLQQVGREAGEAGVTLALEPLNRYETDLINTVEQALHLVESVGSPHVQIHLDTYHMNIEERDVPAAIRRAGKHVAHVHASASDRGAAGGDHIAWPGVRDALAAIDYRNAVVVESFTPGVKEIARAASIWRPLASTQDALATDSFAFLHNLFG